MEKEQIDPEDQRALQRINQRAAAETGHWRKHEQGYSDAQQTGFARSVAMCLGKDLVLRHLLYCLASFLDLQLILNIHPPST